MAIQTTFCITQAPTWSAAARDCESVVTDSSQENVTTALEKEVFHIQAPRPLTTDSLAQEAETSPTLHQSLLLHCVRSKQELLCIAKAFAVHEAVRNIIPVSIERLVSHNMVRKLILDFSSHEEVAKKLVKFVNPLTQRFLKDQLDSVSMIRNVTESMVLSYLQSGKEGSISAFLKDSADQLMEQVTHLSPTMEVEQQHSAVAMRAADIFVEILVKEAIEKYDIGKTPELQNYQLLPRQSHATRRIFMVNGGIASGKSQAQQMVLREASTQGIPAKDICVINRDSLRPVLLKPEELSAGMRPFFPSLTEDETMILREAILNDYSARMRANTAPHAYIDQVTPSLNVFRIAADRTSNGLDLIMISTPVELALQRAKQRWLETGYHTVTKGLLTSHASLPIQLVTACENAKKEGKDNVRLRILDNSGEKTLPRVAFEADLSRNTLVVHDEESLSAFFRKIHINCAAQRFSELYLTPSDVENTRSQELAAALARVVSN